MKVFHSLISGLLLGTLVLGGCAPDITETDFFSRHPDPSEAQEDDLPRLLGQQTLEGWDLALLSRGEIHAGYNHLLVRLNRSGTDEHATSARLQLIPTREEDGSTIAAPVESPLPVEADDSGYFSVPVLFLQPKGPTFTWQVAVVAQMGSETRTGRFDVPVVDSLWLQEVVSPGQFPYYVAWVQPGRPKTGEDTIAFDLFARTEDGFAPIDDASVDLYPYMDMGGGDGHSTPYAAPAHTAKGRYEGRINFIMSGGWDMTVFVDRPGEARDTVLFPRFIVY
ncbi:MAG: FixH family protein [Rhodothermales bacterium]